MVLAEDSVQLVPLVQLVRKANPALPGARLVRLVRLVRQAFRGLPEARLGRRVRLVRLGHRLRGITLEHSTSESATPSEIWRRTKATSGIAKTPTAETWETYRAPSRLFGISSRAEVPTVQLVTTGPRESEQLEQLELPGPFSIPAAITRSPR